MEHDAWPERHTDQAHSQRGVNEKHGYRTVIKEQSAQQPAFCQTSLIFSPQPTRNTKGEQCRTRDPADEYCFRCHLADPKEKLEYQRRSEQETSTRSDFNNGCDDKK